MIKKVTEYSIVNSYDSDILVFVDAKLLLESFKDKGLWTRFVAYMGTVASDSHVNSGTINVNESDCDSFHFMCVNTGIDGSECKTWVDVKTGIRSRPSAGHILIESGYIMCIPYKDIEDHILGRYLGSVTVGTFFGDCGMSYKTSGMFDDKPSACIEVHDMSGRFYKIDCSQIMVTEEGWKRFFQRSNYL